MKKRIRFQILLALCIFIVSCNTEGHRGVSKSICDSKSRFAFIGKYEKTYSSIMLTVEEPNIILFIEKSWIVETNRVSNDLLNWVMVVDRNHFFENFRIGNFTFAHKNVLTYLDSTGTPSDTVEFEVFRKYDDKRLGKLVFVKETFNSSQCAEK